MRTRLKFLGLGLGLTALWGVAINESYRYQQLEARTLIAEQASNLLSETRRHFNRLAVRQRDDILHVKLDLLASGVLAPGRAFDRAAVEAILQRAVVVDSTLAQVRWLDATGWERARLDQRRLPDGRPALLPAATLQNKAGRYYFSNAIHRRNSEIQISSIDLNQEHGKIVVPLEPTMRLSNATHPSEGLRSGLLVLNYNLATIFSQMRARHAPGIDIELLNNEGDWLYNSRAPEREWARDLGRTDSRLSRNDPALARALRGDSDFQHSGNHYRVLVSQITPGSPHRLWLVSHVSPTHVDVLARQDLYRQLPLFGIAYLLGALMIWLVYRGDRRLLASNAELASTKRTLRTVLDGVPSVIGYWDRHLVNRVANLAYHRWFGVDHGTLPGMHIRQLLGEALYEQNREHIEGALRGEPQNFERSIPGPDGRVRHSLAHYLPDTIDGEVCGFFVIVHDVTELVESRHQLAAALRKNAALLRSIDEQMLYSVADVDGLILEANDNFCRISGYARDELLGHNHNLINAGVHPPEFWTAMWTTITSGQPWHGEVCNRARDGSVYWVDTVIAPFIGADGTIERYVSLRSDITARKLAEAELNRVHLLLGNVLDSASEIAIIATDTEGVIDVFNAGAEKMLGYRADDLVGKATPARFHDAAEVAARGAELSAEYGKAIEGFRVFVHKPEHDGPETREWTYLRRDGSRLPVSLVVTARRDPAGQVIGYLGIAEDITERRRTRTALTQAKQAAEAANAAKSEFLANMSHEIRTPMNAVIGIAHLLERSVLEARQRELLGQLKLAGRSLMGIINDVLDIAKIEAGEMTLESAPYDPTALCDDIAALYRPQAEAKGLVFTLERDADLPPSLLGDAQRLRQILANLVGNALKFTDAGDITLVVRADHSTDQPALRWSVRDSGCGIDSETQARLFTPFTQASASTARHYGGSGLGLSIVRQLATLMGGEVGVTSTPGVGSTFWVRLPLRRADRPPAPRSGLESSVEIWVVDDDDADRARLTGMSQALGWRTRHYPSGVAMLDALAGQQRTNDSLPDALLIDWHMPELDGLATLNQASELLGSARLPATLIVSAETHAAVAAADHAHLADQILTKPIGHSELFNAVNASVARHHGNTDRIAGATRLRDTQTCWLPGVAILVADDSAINLDVARRLLELEGAQVTTARHGREALEKLRAAPQAFDAVLMDVQMPVMDGYAATRALRADPALAHLPVLALTASALLEERRRAEASGMDDFLTKPLDPDTLIRALRRVIEKSRGTPLKVQHSQASETPAHDWPQITGIDSDAVRKRLNGDAPLFLNLLARTLEDCRDVGDAAGLRHALATDRAALAARLHKLRGVAGLLGASALQNLAGDAERHLRDNRTTAEIEAALDTLADAMRELAAAVEATLVNTPPPPEAPPAPRLAVSLPADDTLFADLDTLRTRLQQQDLDAIAQFQRLTPLLQAHYGQAQVDALQRALDRLDFGAALALLDRAASATFASS